MINIKGGTTSSEFTQTGYTESEQQLDPVTGKKIGKPVLVEFPDGN